jgi:hypothetical protein
LKPSTLAISARVGGGTGVGDGVLDQFQNFLLPGGEFGAVGHGGLLEGLVELLFHPVTVFLTSF